MYRNKFRGVVNGLVLQVGQIEHLTITSRPLPMDNPKPLIRALNTATVVFESPLGTGRGIRVGRSLMLTLASLVPEASPIPDHPDFALLDLQEEADELFACIGTEQPIGAFQFVLEHVPGSPVLNSLTGEVCALVTGPETTTPVPALQLGHDLNWLDLMEPDQLKANGRQHLTPALRAYLVAVRQLGQQHEYERAADTGPDLHTIYLERWAENDTDEEETTLPDKIEADELLAAYPNAQVVADPGIGKSSLIRHFAAQTADAWLTGRGGTVVPVPITADAFRGKFLPEMLADGGLAEPDLPRQQLVELFDEEPPRGAKWMILVDGLDEIVDPHLRANVLRRIRRLRNNPSYLITLTSRRLTATEVSRFHHAGHPTYVLKPFRPEDLDQFVSTWLEREGRPEAEAAHLVDRLHESKLEELIYVPLIATMVCSLHCASPDADVPRDQTELYRRFVDWQLSKVSQHDLGARLRQWQAKSGQSAEQVTAEIRDRLLPLLCEVAHGVLTVVPEPAVLEYTTSRFPEADRDALDEALRMSGLIVSRGQELVFRHRTIAEYLAACHVMTTRPRAHWLLEPSWSNRWEWPDLGMKVFLAALLIEAGVDIRRQLRHLMWPTFRNQHIGFLAALVRHGVQIDDKVLARAAKRLTKTTRSPSTGNQWQQHVQWLEEIDTDAATAVLRSMIGAPEKLPPNRHFEAIRYLIGMDVYANAEFVVHYLSTPQVEQIARNSVHKLLSEIDLELTVRVFAEVATEAPEGGVRLQCSEIVLSHDAEAGLKLLARLSRHTSTSDEVRIRAINLVSAQDQSLGFLLWSEFMVTARHEESRSRAMELLYRHDPASTVEHLQRARKNRELPARQRHEFGLFLVQQAGHDPTILLETAAHHKVPTELRVQAALLNRTTDLRGAIKVLQDVVDRRKPGEHDLLKNIGHLRSLDEGKGVAALVKLAKDEREPEDLRLQAADRLPDLDAIEVYDDLVDDRGLSDAGNLTVARKLLSTQRTRGIEALVRLSGHSWVATQVRMQAAHDSSTHRPEAGYRAYAAIVNDHSVADALRVRAAVEARKAVRSKGNALLKGLVRAGLNGEAQLALAAAMGRTDRAQLLDRIAGSSLPLANRFTAAERLIISSGAQAASLAYQKIADSRDVPQHKRLQAQEEADRLRNL